MISILGISSFYHDSSACLIQDGEILGAMQEERFTRVKHDKNFPKNSIKSLLNENNLKLSDIDYVVFYEKPFLKFERLLETYIAFAPNGFESFCASMPIWLREKLFQKKLIFEELQKIDSNFKDILKIKFSEHHLSHAASAYYPSPYDNALVLTLDGVGEWATTTIGIGKKNKVEILEEIHFPHSLGLLYSAFTYYLGFKVNSGEYKVMGLAPYGEPRFKDIILDNLIEVKDDGSFRMDMRYFNYATGLTMTNSKFDKLFNKKKRNSETDELTQFHMDIAASLQVVTEIIVLKICRYIKGKFKINNLCMAGGVALNCVANGKIIKEKIFDNVWIQPASGDAGGSLGAALAFWYLELNKERKIVKIDSMKGSYLGTFYKNDEVEKILINCGAIFKKYNTEKILLESASLLSQGKAIGWFHGRAEFGPRALGNRSIIADPRSEQMQKNLNLKVKFRESFRPFAPAIIREKLNTYFDLDVDSPYMLFVADIKKKLKITMNEEEKKLFGIDKLNIKRSSIPAVTHVDYSSRIQTVHKNINPVFYGLLEMFEKLTNCPVLVNTSFNIRGEPIVNTPEEAFRCLMGTDLDALVCENFIILKDQQDIKLKKDYKDNFNLD